MGILGMHEEDEIGKKKFQASHAGGYNATSDIELVAIADTDEEKLSRFGDAWDIPTTQQYLDHAKMVDLEDLDVVSVCTPSFLHHRHVIDAAPSASIRVIIWCEKPIASLVTDAVKMISACEDTNAELLVNHSFRFTNKLQQLAQLIHNENLLVDVNSIATQFRMELLRNSTHLLDTLVYLLDSRAKLVSGYITGDNEAVDSLDAGTTVDDAGGGGFVLMDDGTFTTIDCTIPRNDSAMMLQIYRF